MAEDEKFTLSHKIIEILVQTQYACWIDKGPKTATEINSQTERAMAYFGTFNEGTKGITYDQIKFHSLIHHQVDLIMQVLDETIDKVEQV